MAITAFPACDQTPTTDKPANAKPIPPAFIIHNQTGGTIHRVMLTGPNMPLSFGTIANNDTRQLKDPKLEVAAHCEIQYASDTGAHVYRSLNFNGISRTTGGVIRLIILGPDKIDVQTY